MNEIRFGVTAGMARIAGAASAPAAHAWSAVHASPAVAAAPQRKRRTAAATDAFVNRGFV